MRKSIYIIGITLIIASCVNAQDNRDKVCIRNFYRVLFSNNKVSVSEFSKIYCNASPDYEVSLLINTGKLKKNDGNYIKYQKEFAIYSDTIESQVLNRMRSYMMPLTQGLNYESICNHIDESPVYNEGTSFSILLELKLSEKNVIYFELNTDTPKQIQYVWLSSGESLGDLVQGNKTIEKLKRPGIINDTDGYTNIRDKPDKNSQISAKLINGEVFYYSPTNDSDWWCVYKEEGGEKIGYIHKSRILKYADFTPELKKKVKEQRSGC